MKKKCYFSFILFVSKTRVNVLFFNTFLTTCPNFSLKEIQFEYLFCSALHLEFAFPIQNLSDLQNTFTIRCQQLKIKARLFCYFTKRLF